MEKRSKTENDILTDMYVDGYDYLGNSASASDCTGLIPSAPLSEAELTSYEDLYHYRSKASFEEDYEDNLPSGQSIG